MITTQDYGQATKQFGTVTRSLAGLCHTCNICPYADRKPHSAFGRLMPLAPHMVSCLG